MSNEVKKSILIFVIVLAIVLSLSSVAFAADPLYIYYENEDGEIVRANYQHAVDNLFDDDATLRDALRNAINEALERAIGAFRNVWVEDQSGPVIDYDKAVDDQLTYPEALDDLQTYGTDRPNHVKVLIIDPDTGQAVEKRWLVSVGDLANIEVDYGTSLADARGKLPTANDLVLSLSDGNISPADSVYWTPADAVYWDEGDPANIFLEAGTYSFEGELGMPECVINLYDLKAEVDVIVSDPNYVTFTVEDSVGDPLEGVTINVEKVIVGTVTSALEAPASWEEVTDANGKAEFALSNGEYSYTASKAGYLQRKNDFTVNNADKDKTIVLFDE